MGVGQENSTGAAWSGRGSRNQGELCCLGSWPREPAPSLPLCSGQRWFCLYFILRCQQLGSKPGWGPSTPILTRTPTPTRTPSSCPTKRGCLRPSELFSALWGRPSCPPSKGKKKKKNSDRNLILKTKSTESRLSVLFLRVESARGEPEAAPSPPPCGERGWGRGKGLGEGARGKGKGKKKRIGKGEGERGRAGRSGAEQGSPRRGSGRERRAGTRAGLARRSLTPCFSPADLPMEAAGEPLFPREEVLGGGARSAQVRAEPCRALRGGFFGGGGLASSWGLLLLFSGFGAALALVCLPAFPS